MMYTVALIHVYEMERGISGYIRNCLDVPRSLSNIALYRHNTRLYLPLSSLIEKFKDTKAWLSMTLRDSEDLVVIDNLPGVRTDTKWSAWEETEAMESCLCHKDIVGAAQTGKDGLGMKEQTYFYIVSDYEKNW